MTLHLISAKRLAKRLSAGEVTAQEQAFYLSAGFILWLLPGYLLIVPAPNVQAWSIPLGLWFYELGTLVVVYVFGILYCLARCHVEPQKNFLVDFSCLYVPVSLTTLVVGWGAYHVYASLFPALLQKFDFSAPPRALEFIYSARFYDLMRFFAVVSVSFFSLERTGRFMATVSRLRQLVIEEADPAASPP